VDGANVGIGMTYFACFNELSMQPLCTSEAAADQRVRHFLVMLREVRKHTNITKVRHDGDMTTIKLTPTLTLQDYLNVHTTNPAVRALLGIFTHPQVDMDDDISLKSYFDTTTEVKEENGLMTTADGFNAAYCQNTFCVGFESCAKWQNDFFDLTVTSNGKSKNVQWACISSPLVYSTLQEHAHRKSAFDEWLQERDVELIKTTLLPEQKTSNVEGDHGQHELKEHAKMLNNHPYVEGVLTSLPFKPQTRNYILNITDDGLVDIVLWWEDAGYSMRVKTTGRNAAETRKIAIILRDKFGRRK
jgi:hypothetical protein